MATKRSAPRAPKKPNLHTAGVKDTYHKLDELHIYENAQIDGESGWTIIAYKKGNLKQGYLPNGR